MTKLNLVQQGGELAYLLLHDPEFRYAVRREHLYEAGKRVRLKPNIDAAVPLSVGRGRGLSLRFLRDLGRRRSR